MSSARCWLVVSTAATLLLAGGQATAASVIFADNFNRADGAVGNGWVASSANGGAELALRNAKLTTQDTGAGMYRPLNYSGSVSATVRITDHNGFGGLQDRFGTQFLFGGSGDPATGYSIEFYRGDQNFANSAVSLRYNGDLISSVQSSFQFSSEIVATVDVGYDGEISGSVAGGGNLFSFDFGDVGDGISGLGTFGLFQEGPDNRSGGLMNATLDDLVISSTDPASQAFEDAIRGAVQVFPMETWLDFIERYGIEAKYPPALLADHGSFAVAGMGATFQPNGGLSLEEAAQLGGFDHFNWAQGITVAGEPMRIDPRLGCNEALAVRYQSATCGGGFRNRDELPWYLDEQFTVEGDQVYDDNGARVGDASLLTRLEEWVHDGRTMLFSDSPTIDDARFITCLAGIRADGSGVVLPGAGCFAWETPGALVEGPVVTEGINIRGLAPIFRGFLDPNDAADAGRIAELGGAVAGVPEPSAWLVITSGFGAVGAALRRRKAAAGGHVGAGRSVPRRIFRSRWKRHHCVAGSGKPTDGPLRSPAGLRVPWDDDAGDIRRQVGIIRSPYPVSLASPLSLALGAARRQMRTLASVRKADVRILKRPDAATRRIV